MLRSVPAATSRCFGTTAVKTPVSVTLTNKTWLPFDVVSTKPTASSRRLTSRYGSGLSGANLDLDRTNLGEMRGGRWLEVEFECLP